MATSPDYLRLAASTARALADVALDSLRDAVVVVDARHKHLPVVFANASARRCLSSADADGLVESSLNDWLGAASVSAIEALALADRRSPAAHILEWRGAEGELSVFTDIRPLPMAPAQRLVMLTFAAAAPAPAMTSHTAAAVDADPVLRTGNRRYRVRAGLRHGVRNDRPQKPGLAVRRRRRDSP